MISLQYAPVEIAVKVVWNFHLSTNSLFSRFIDNSNCELECDSLYFIFFKGGSTEKNKFGKHCTEWQSQMSIRLQSPDLKSPHCHLLVQDRNWMDILVSDISVQRGCNSVASHHTGYEAISDRGHYPVESNWFPLIRYIYKWDMLWLTWEHWWWFFLALVF